MHSEVKCMGVFLCPVFNKYLTFPQRITHKYSGIKVFPVYIHPRNTAVMISGVVVNALVRVAAACINRYHIFTVTRFNRTLDLLN